MNIKHLSPDVSISSCLGIAEVNVLQEQNVRAIIHFGSNVSSSSEDRSRLSEEAEAIAELHRIQTIEIDVDETDLRPAIGWLIELSEHHSKLHLLSENERDAAMLWALSQVQKGIKQLTIVTALERVGINLTAAELNTLSSSVFLGELAAQDSHASELNSVDYFDVVIVGGGAGGISLASMLRKTDKALKLAILDPSADLYYQPGWTMVGGGELEVGSTKKLRRHFIPNGVVWLRHAAEQFLPENSAVVLDSGKKVHYQQLVIATGLELHWDGVKGLRQALGRDGVTSNYRYDLAPYTWELISTLDRGTAVFTQPDTPIKSVGASQQAMYLAADHWRKQGVLKHIDLNFCTAGDSLFDLPDYLSTLNEYSERYHVHPRFGHSLVEVDGAHNLAYFQHGESEQRIKLHYDILHVCPPQRAPACVRNSELADVDGWLDVDPKSLQHCRFDNIWGVGDVINAPNAKTLSAVRKQVPVLIKNLTDALSGKSASAEYDGYASCPMAVEHGKTLLTEYAYSGNHAPTFPEWINHGTQATKLAWNYDKSILPWAYWSMILRGREFLAAPNKSE
jgi:sulfide:quinone oxidoreductase